MPGEAYTWLDITDVRILILAPIRKVESERHRLLMTEVFCRVTTNFNIGGDFFNSFSARFRHCHVRENFNPYSYGNSNFMFAMSSSRRSVTLC